MKKKLFVIIFSIILLVGCNKEELSNNTNLDSSGKGKLYTVINLQDKGINMFRSIVPKGWNSYISSQDLVNSSYPFVETVVLSNPEGTARITIISQHSYTENSKYREGINTDYYTTYMHKMNADEYIDYYMNTYYPGSTFIEDKEVEEKTLNELKTLHDLKVQMGKNDANLLSTQNYGVYLDVYGVEYTSSIKDFEYGTNYIEVSTSTSAIATTIKSSLSSLLDSKAIQWYMPYIIIYEGMNKEEFDKYYEDYKFIIANSNFTVNYYAMIEYVSSAIVNAYTSIYAEKSKIALQATNDYIDSTYSSTSSVSTNDKVMEMWDDVIKEVDSYKTEDGSTIKTSIMNDTVAQNGNEIYVGTKAGIPLGFNELAKGY